MIVGLGNPGPPYAHTRHNLGFQVLDALAERENLSWKEVPTWKARASLWGKILLLQPLTFMNLSGQAVQPAARYYRIEPHQILIVLDDLALPVGRMRLRKAGSDGGHNGLASVLQHLGTREVPRLRIGIGTPAGNPKDFVLEKPDAAEQEIYLRAIGQSLETISQILDKGLDAAMNTANTSGLS
jgi:PTH1 family peptidyl-tRNA hydrolase